MDSLSLQPEGREGCRRPLRGRLRSSAPRHGITRQFRGATTGLAAGALANIADDSAGETGHRAYPGVSNGSVALCLGLCGASKATSKHVKAAAGSLTVAPAVALTIPAAGGMPLPPCGARTRAPSSPPSEPSRAICPPVGPPWCSTLVPHHTSATRPWPSFGHGGYSIPDILTNGKHRPETRSNIARCSCRGRPHQRWR